MIVMMMAAAAAMQGSGPGPVTPRQVEGAKAALDARLLDYPSARFRDVRGTGLALCGFVNAKNRMGAFTGWTRFAWVTSAEPFELYIDDPDGKDDVMLDAFCGEDGLRNQGRDYSDQMTRRGG